MNKRQNSIDLPDGIFGFKARTVFYDEIEYFQIYRTDSTLIIAFKEEQENGQAFAHFKGKEVVREIALQLMKALAAL